MSVETSTKDGLPPTMPDLEPKKRPLGDRTSVLKIIKRWKDFMMSEDTQRRFDNNVDLTKRDMQIRLKETYLSIDMDFLEEMGINASLYKSFSAHGFLPFVMAFYKEDKEIVHALTGFGQGMTSDIAVGAYAPEVSVLSMETMQELDICDLSMDKSKPLVILSGSLSCPMLKVCIPTGGFSQLLQKYKNRAEFVIVYTAEAHPADGWKLGKAISSLKQHRSVDDRLEAARTMMEYDRDYDTSLTSDPFDTAKVRVVLEDMTNPFTSTYKCGPIRAVALENGRVVWMGPNVIHLMSNPRELMCDKIEAWLRGRFEENEG